MLFRKRQGFVLIFALWVLGFLTVLAVGVAAGIRQKIIVLQKLDQRSRISHVQEAAVKYAIGYISQQLNLFGQVYNTTVKMNLHNNPEAFGQFDLAGDNASISYTLADQVEYFGVVDEERKININLVTVNTLSRLIEKVFAEKPDDARKFAEAILDWRQFGESQLLGFFSEGYYTNLEYPYPKKNAPYETLDELLLVKEMTKEKYEKLINFVTIYGDGRVNINTASAEVLYSLGLEDSLIEKIIEARQGKDATEASADDHVFTKTFDVATELNQIVKLQPDETHAIDKLNLLNALTTNSYYFSITAHTRLPHSSFFKITHAIISSRENKIMYWKER
jgi:type II secretory pathway component PulK